MTVTPSTLDVDEGATARYTVKLNTAPTGDVTVAISSNNTDVTVSPSSLTFTADNWNSAQTVTVSAGQDDDPANDMATLTHNPSGADYGSVGDADLAVTVTDDETRGVTVTPTSLTVNEGGTNTYTVVLDTQPTATVTVTINDPSNTDVTAEPASLTFSSTDWNTPKTVTVNAAQDADAEDETATVTHTVTSTDSIYSGASANSVAVMVTDDEVPVTVQFGATTYEVVEGETVTVAVTLSADPERTVVIPLTHTPQSGADSPADYSGVPPSVTFNTGQMSQTITFTAAQDDVDDDGESVLLAFGTLPPAVSLGTTTQATVSITDDDGAGVSVSESSLTIAEGSSGTYTIVLDSQPTANVTVTINDPSNTDVTAEPASLTFSSTDWNTPKTVTVEAGQDNDAVNDTATLTHTASGGDYNLITIASVVVTVTDNDTPTPTPGSGGGAVVVVVEVVAAVVVVAEAPTVRLKSRDPRASNTRNTAPSR